VLKQDVAAGWACNSTAEAAAADSGRSNTIPVAAMGGTSTQELRAVHSVSTIRRHNRAIEAWLACDTCGSCGSCGRVGIWKRCRRAVAMGIGVRQQWDRE
jgi:hypothetical protein